MEISFLLYHVNSVNRSNKPTVVVYTFIRSEFQVGLSKMYRIRAAAGRVTDTRTSEKRNFWSNFSRKHPLHIAELYNRKIIGMKNDVPNRIIVFCNEFPGETLFPPFRRLSIPPTCRQSTIPCHIYYINITRTVKIHSTATIIYSS